MTNLQKLEQRIRELVPSLLKDGCESTLEKEECIKQFNCRYCKNGDVYFQTELHHVLQAIDIKSEEHVNIGFSRKGKCIIVLDSSGVGCIWNLSTDLSGQSSETIDFLLELLTNK